ncbi:TetR family transcriptional regulator [Virgisporangium aliadipatigenens]|uniref:TetR family transcriptional regulator n=1 Tax=Virgisporangium aliadipatigenens TaxID=741659 RepID=A0A8J3YVB2_9ACTN|nr:TetR/AcrR family transcriptional regulator [Virgisporangium aliadipatigenens]GIJ50480.1 TetR family transcriptional regulator [Virgisporangium aliadipatigenens]
MIDGRLQRGERTRTAVLDRTLLLASAEGLSGLSLARLADTLNLSKSGLFAHWGSKEALQLAVIEHARSQWEQEVIRPAVAAPRGLRRLWATHDRRMAYYESEKQPGCFFFANAYFEYNARPGAVRERLLVELADWVRYLTGLVEQAVEIGELPPGIDASALVHLTDALGVYAAMQAPAVGAAVTCRGSRVALLTHLRSLATDPTVLPEPT